MLRQRLSSQVVTDIPGLVVVILVSCGCHNNLPQTERLKITEIYSFIVWKTEVQTKCQQGLASHYPWRLQGKNYSFPLVELGIPWLLCAHPIVFPASFFTWLLSLVCLFFPECLIRIRVIGFRAHLESRMISSQDLQKLFFQIRYHSQILGFDVDIICGLFIGLLGLGRNEERI